MTTIIKPIFDYKVENGISILSITIDESEDIFLYNYNEGFFKHRGLITESPQYKKRKRKFKSML
jgi:hypothetical protein